MKIIYQLLDEIGLKIKNISMILKNFYTILKTSLFQFIWLTFLISFLLFFLNLLIGISYNISNFSDDIKDKLWIYFYIKDSKDPKEKDFYYTKTIHLKSELEDNGLRIEFYSKEDALNLLEKRMPDVIKNFETYWIDNPLPPTLYVIFDNKEKYEKLKQIIPKYESIIVNIEDISKWQSFSQQEARIKNIINLTNFLVVFSYFLILVLLIIIVSFLLLIIKIVFNNFYQQIEVEKLLWAFWFQTKAPFLLYIKIVLVTAFLLMVYYFSAFFAILNVYFVNVFEVDLYMFTFVNFRSLGLLLLVEMALIITISVMISNFFLNKLISKV